MCGIAGFLDVSRLRGNSELQSIVRRMSDSLSHRGPDDSGIWVDDKAGIALGHRRLSILDLSPQGHQPMISQSGRYVITYNGEIYNYNEIRKELESLQNSELIKWRSHSDTEVMLAAIEEWGLEDAVKRFVGMFAFVLWDQKDRVLHLVRDRLGEKPLYYGWAGKVFVFGSELKAFRAHPLWQGEIERNSLTLLLRHNCIPAPHSIYKDVFKLLPGAILSISWAQAASKNHTIKNYWSAREAAEQGMANAFAGTEQEAVYELDRMLREAVKLRMHADVPLGAFLSGGVDSSAIAALMQAQSERPVRTFSIGFHEADYNEAQNARAVAQHLRTDHTELYINTEDALAVIPMLPELYDEPFSDSSQIPTFLVSKMARQHVQVCLSGDGGDELFGGYNRYSWVPNIWQRVGSKPRLLRSVIGKGLTAVSPKAWDKIFQAAGSFLPAGTRQRMAGDKLHKLADILQAHGLEDMYYMLTSHWLNPEELVKNAHEPATILTDRSVWPKLPDFTKLMMYLDMVSYLPDDILVKLDRASMGVSLESRVPFLDHRLIEFAWKIPLSMNVSKGQGKWLLRQVLYKYVPRELVERPKMGFGVPIDSWLRGPLRAWAESLLGEKRLGSEGFFNPQPIRQKWHEHLSGRRNWQYHLWDVLMFQAWNAYWNK